MGLEKAAIKRYLPKGGPTIEVLFNPTEYRLAQSNQFAEIAVPGLEVPLLQYTRGNVRNLTMQLFFDTYEQGQDVRQHTRKLINLLEINSQLHAPPVCQFIWGGLTFICVLERADQRFTLFLPSGIPVRATVDVTFKEFWDKENQGGRLQSANFSKHHVVKRGDTLSGIAGQKYDDPTIWRVIAEANNVDDPMNVPSGTVLLIPAIE